MGEIELIERVVLDNSDVGNRPIVDMKINSTPGVAVYVNDEGIVYKCDFGSGWKSLDTLPEASSSGDSFWWGLSLLQHGEGCIFSSEKLVKRLDWRTDDNRMDLFSTLSRTDLITAVQGPQSNNLMQLCTTSEIIWMDIRFSGMPLLGYKHGRSYDRTLATYTHGMPLLGYKHGRSYDRTLATYTHDTYTFLTSRKNGFVTVYDVSRSEDGLIGANVPAYHVPSPSSHYDACPGGLLLHHEFGPGSISLYQLTERGSLHCVDFSLSASTVIEAEEPNAWPSDVQVLEYTAEKPVDVGPLGNRDCTKIDLMEAYQKIFLVDVESSDDNSDTLMGNSLQNMHSYWQETPSPQQMLTLFDVAFDSCETDEQEEQPRAAFLTKSNIDSAQGYDAAKENLIPTQYVERDAARHFNVSPTLEKLDPGTPFDLESLNDHLRHYKADTLLERPTRMQDEAQNRLSLDLFLAADVYAPRAFNNVDSDSVGALENMSRAAEALTLADEPPPVRLGYLQLRPGISTNPLHHITRTDTPATQDFDGPLTVRLLLNEWSIGTDPEFCEYQDPYEESNQPMPIRRRQHAEVNATAQTLGPARSQVPPMVVASKPTAPPIVGVDLSSRGVPTWNTTGYKNMSQPSGLPMPPMGSQAAVTDAPGPSQEFLSSTQVLPGPFGGRQPVKKKPAKKRIGGF
ncbi:hypothetical protein HWV62_35125 [Athelia sp. TMB]|nr:hypothetical protein HWV62_35125 [Athelia sp. TMB]